MKLFHYGILTGFLLSGCAMLSAKEIASRLNYRICVPDQPEKIEITAAQELASYLAATYSKKIRLNGSEAPICFSVGFAPEAEKFSKNRDAFKESGFGVLCKDRTILLTGRDIAGYEEGTLLSVYYFLRRYTGLKIYAPDPVHGEKTGQNPELKLPAVDKPQFSFRIRGIGKAFKDVSVKEINRYARKQLCHEPYWATNNIYYVVLNNWSKRFKDQPEMFGLYKGKRKSIKYPYHLPCLTNPKVKEVIVNDILDMIRKRKLEDKAVIRIFCDAPFQRCECTNCSRIATNDDYFYGFILSVRDAVKKHYPQTRLFLQEKGASHCNPPSTGDLKDVVVDISSGYPEKMDYRKNHPLFRKWLDRGALPTIRLYARYPQWTDCPIINPHDIAANFRAMKGLALGQRRSDCSKSIPYAFAALTNYVHVNCLLNADADPDELIREFCTFMYPGAEKEMIKFYDWMEKRQSDLGVWENPYLKCYFYDALDYPLSLLDEASKKCTNPFWLNKLRTAFNSFRKKAEAMRHLTVNAEKNFKIVTQRKLQFKKDYSHPFRFSTAKTVFPLCPADIPLAPIQESSVTVQVKTDRLLFQLTAMEEHTNMLRKNAKPEKSENIWGDDHFEIMIAPEKQNYPYLHLTINPNGALSTLWNDDTGRNQQMKMPVSTWNTTAEIKKDRWIAGVSVPLFLIRKICPDGKGRIGIFRKRVLSCREPEKKEFFTANSGLDTETPSTSNHHDITRYHPFIIGEKL